MKNIFNKKALFVLVTLFAMSFVSGVNNFFAAATATSINFEEKIILPDAKLIEYIKKDLTDLATSTNKMKVITPAIDKVLKVLGKTKDDIVSLHADPNTPGTKIEITELKNLTMKHEYVKNIFATSPANLPLVNQEENLKLKASVNLAIIEGILQLIKCNDTDGAVWKAADLTSIKGSVGNNVDLDITLLKINDAANAIVATEFDGQDSAVKTFKEAFKEIFYKKTKLVSHLNQKSDSGVSATEEISNAFCDLLTGLNAGAVSTNMPGTYTGVKINAQDKTIQDIMEGLKVIVLKNANQQIDAFLNDFNSLCDQFTKIFVDNSENIKSQADLLVFLEHEIKDDLLANTTTLLYDSGNKGKFKVTTPTNAIGGYKEADLGVFNNKKAADVFDNVVVEHFQEEITKLKTAAQPAAAQPHGNAAGTCSVQNCPSTNKIPQVCKGCYDNKVAVPANQTTNQQPAAANQTTNQQPAAANTQVKTDMATSITELGTLTNFDQSKITKGVKALNDGKTEIERLEAELLTERNKTKANPDDVKELKELKEEKEKKDKYEKTIMGKVKGNMVPTLAVTATTFLGIGIGIDQLLIKQSNKNDQVQEGGQGQSDNSQQSE